MEVIGILLGLSTGWFFRERGVRAKREQQQEHQQRQRWRQRQAESQAHAQRRLTDGDSSAASTSVAAIVPVESVLVVGSRRRPDAGRGAPRDGEAVERGGRSSLSERLARGVPVLGATL